MLTTTVPTNRTKAELYSSLQQSEVFPIRPKTESFHQSFEAEIESASEEEIEQLLIRFREEIDKAGYTALREVTLEISENGEAVELSGTVPSYHMKQIAQNSIRRIDTNVRVCNEIVVHWPNRK